MPLTSTNVELEYLGVTDGQVIVASIPCYSAEDIYLTYGDDYLVAVQGPDYSVSLDLPPGSPPPINDTDYQFVTIVIHNPLIVKIGGGTNIIRIGRKMDLTTDFSETDANFRNRISTEFTRTNMKLQQIDFVEGTLLAANEASDLAVQAAEDAAASAAAADASEANALASAAAADASEAGALASATAAANSAAAADASEADAEAAAAAAGASASLIPLPGGLPDAGKVIVADAFGNAYILVPLTGGGDMLRANNLSDLLDKAASRVNLGVAIGTNVQAYDADLAAVAGLSGTGVVVHTGAGTMTERSIVGGLGISVTPSNAVASNPIVAATGQLAEFASIPTTGLIARIGPSTQIAQRTIVATTPIVVNNGDGVAGNPAFILNANAYRFKGTTKITASGTYTKPADVTAIMVEAVGGGGAGGGADSDGTNAGEAGGGASGAYAKVWITAPAASYSVTIGAGGVGALPTANGGDGGTTSFGAVFTCPGGGGGWTVAPGASTVAHGGFPGTTPTGTFDIGYAGQPGENGVKLSATLRASGNGAGSLFGSGGKAWASANGATSSPAQPGLGYGSGGAGAMALATTDLAGSAGAPGLVLVHEYVL